MRVRKDYVDIARHPPPQPGPERGGGGGLRQRRQGARRPPGTTDPGRRLPGRQPARSPRAPAARRGLGAGGRGQGGLRRDDAGHAPGPARTPLAPPRSPTVTRRSWSCSRPWVGSGRPGRSLDMRNGWLSVVDAATGRVVYRQNLVATDNARVWDNYPGAAEGRDPEEPQPGHQRLAAQPLDHAERERRARLQGRQRRRRRRRRPRRCPTPARRAFNYPFTPFAASGVPDGLRPARGTPIRRTPGRPTPTRTPSRCSTSWARIHDHLAARADRLHRAAGNFEAVDGDAVDGNALDGANTGGRAAGRQPHRQRQHVDARPTASPPRMQMYLFHLPGTAYPDEDPFLAGNSGDEADVVYHEYTHGLSNRLVVDANGISTLGNIQAGSMGEAWSDWYAMDFLVDKGYFTDTPASGGDVRLGEYVGWGNDLIRTQPIDCPVGLHVGQLPGHSRRRTRRLHLRRLRPGHRRPRGARRRRDLGADAVGPAQRAWASELGRDPGHPGHGALAGQPVVPGHAQRHPGRPTWSSTAARDQTGHLDRSSPHRGMGCFAASTLDGDDTASGGGLLHAAAARTPRPVR